MPGKLNVWRTGLRAGLALGLLSALATTAKAQKTGPIPPRRDAKAPPHNAEIFGHYAPQWRRWPVSWSDAPTAKAKADAAPRPAPAKADEKKDEKPAEPVKTPPPVPTPSPQGPAAPDAAPDAQLPGALPDAAPLDDTLPPLEPSEEPGQMPDALPLDNNVPSLPKDDDLPPLDFDDNLPTDLPADGDPKPQTNWRHGAKRPPLSRRAATSPADNVARAGSAAQKTAALKTKVQPRAQQAPTRRMVRVAEQRAPAENTMRQEQTPREHAPREFVAGDRLERLPPVEAEALPETIAAPRGSRVRTATHWAPQQVERGEASPEAAIEREPTPSAPASDSANPLRRAIPSGWKPGSQRLQSNPLRGS